MMNNNPHARLPSESTQAWLERMICIGAPAHIITAVQVLVESENRQALVPQPAGKY